jgi:uncharacterized protein (TIGR03083 family)
VRLPPQRYIELLRADGELMATRAPNGLEREVPPCPGWDVREVMRHTGSVYGHKLVCVRLLREPGEGEWQTEPPAGEDTITWFRAAHAALIGELVSHSPSDASYTWFPEDQTVGFWYRRMALETAVHRVDVESAFNAMGDVDAELAVDGIDEILTIMLDPSDEFPADGCDGTVVVRAGGSSWRVHLAPTRTEAALSPDGARGDATLAGDAAAVFLYLWGRVPAEATERSGDITLVDGLRHRLALATQ